MLQNNMERVGYTKAAATFAVLGLQEKRLVEVRDAENYNGELYPAVLLNDAGFAWFHSNPDKLVIQRPGRQALQLRLLSYLVW